MFLVKFIYKLLTSNVCTVTQKFPSASISMLDKTVRYQCIGVCVHIEYSKLLGPLGVPKKGGWFYSKHTRNVERSYSQFFF
jgi:hypothetical protein